MFRGFVDFFCRLRLPSVRQMFGLFYASRSTTSALTTFNSVIGELEGVADHHTAQSVEKTIAAGALQQEADAHNVEAASAALIAGKLKGLLS